MAFQVYVVCFFLTGFVGQLSGSTGDANDAAVAVRKEADKKARMRSGVRRIAAGAMGVAGLLALLHYYRTRRRGLGAEGEHKALVTQVAWRSGAIEALRAGAMGDALGALVEFCGHNEHGFFESDRPRYMVKGSITSIEDAKAFSKSAYLRVTDDTIMTELTVHAIWQWSLLQSTDRTIDALMHLIADATLANYAQRNKTNSYSWADSHRAPGVQCIEAINQYAHEKKWDRSLYKNRKVGREGGSGKVMDSAAFAFVIADTSLAVKLAQLHAKISHPDSVSQAACAAMAFAISSALDQKISLEKIIEGMIDCANAVSHNNEAAEALEWQKGSVYWPKWRTNESSKPYTVGQRISDVCDDCARGCSLDEILQRNGGWGAPDLVAAVVATALCGDAHGWTVKEAILAVVNANCGVGGIDRDTVASLVGQFLAARGVSMGFTDAEFALIERDGERKKGGDLSSLFA
ncbi:MAG: ADP-ribosylglycohydrolase [Candidatus Dependentiae bacterium]|nr:ADP-ribosylglycohydrolase [Candidatus Dependentiae bacterium]